VNLWEFRSIVSIIEHDGLTIVKFVPGTTIEAVTQKIVDLGYSRAEFELLRGEDPGLVDFRVFSDEEFPLYLCLSQIFNTFPFTSVTLQGEVFAQDVKEIEESGGRLLDALEISFVDALGTTQSARIQQLIEEITGFTSVIMDDRILRLGIVSKREAHGIVHKMNEIARIEHIHGTFAFDLDVEGVQGTHAIAT
jgi:hypothetical protein